MKFYSLIFYLFNKEVTPNKKMRKNEIANEQLTD